MARVLRNRVRPPFAASAEELHRLRCWYDGMAPCWLGMEPPLRRALVLRTHRWIADSILGPAADGRVSGLERELPTRLWASLAELIPADELALWRPWLGLVVNDLEHALRRPVTAWTESWARWLLLIAYSISAPVLPNGRSGQPVRDGRPPITRFHVPLSAALRPHPRTRCFDARRSR